MVFKGNISELAAKMRAAARSGPSCGIPPTRSRPTAAPGCRTGTRREAASSSRTSSSLSSQASSSSSSTLHSVTTSAVNLSAIKENSSQILKGYLEGAVRESTKKSYGYYWARFRKFCEQVELSVHNAEAIGLFLVHLAESTNSKAGALQAKHAIKFNLKLLSPFKKSPTDNYFISRISTSIKKKFGRPIKKAKVFTSDLVAKLVLHLLSSGDFKDERTAIFVLLQFCFFARFEEISKLTKECVHVIAPSHIKIIFPSAKNYDSWDAKTSWVSGNQGGKVDPVKLVQSYLEKIPDKVTWLFPNFRLGKKKSISFINTPISYDNMLKLLRSGLDRIGVDGSEYSLHGIRTGATSEAVNSAKKVERTDLKRHARWKTDGMVDYYHQLSMKKKLAPSRALKLFDS